MDTGLGSDGYSMVGQGKIDSIISQKNEDRRELFEEAGRYFTFRIKEKTQPAGLSRHKKI